MDRRRRSVLQAAGGVLTVGTLAGCLSEPDSENSNTDGYASFFTLWDWAEEIAGDELTFENPVETGEMGHGWEPPGDLQRDIAGTETFIYLDTAEFSWAQDFVSDFESDTDLHLIDGMAGLESELLPVNREADDDREPDLDDEFDPDSLSIAELDLYDRQTGDEIAYWHGDHWHGSLPEVPLEDSVGVEAIFEDDEGRVLPLGERQQFQLEARFHELADEDVVEIESDGDHVRFHGRETGTTRLIFELVADGEVIWDTSNDTISIEVVEELDDSEAPEFYDPHVWVDPVLAQEIVWTIADELADLDPDNAETFEANAEAYVERLESVDEQFQTLTDDADRDVAVFAGHDSFQYLEHRYDFELHTPVGISPDEAETPSDISEAISVVEEHDIDIILYDPFETPGEDEPPQMVELLLENTDADDYAPLSPVEGTTEEWEENGYGWVEQMEEINLQSLRQALGA